MNKVAFKIIIVIILLFTGLFVSTITLAEPLENSAKNFEEIVVNFDVPKLINKDIFVQYDGNTVYLPLVEVFSLLDINVKADMNQRTFSGFFISKNKKYKFDLKNYKITVFSKEYAYLSSDYFLGANDLYVKIDLFKKLFNLDLTFNFSLLRVFAPLNKDFPAYQKLQRKIARERLKKKTASLKDVISVPPKREYLNGGSADWVISTNPWGGRNKHYYNLALGGLLMGGDMEFTLGGSTDNYFDRNQFNYKWHYFFDKNKYLTQADIGKINTVGSLGRPLKGVMVTNRPQVRRKFFQTININDYLGTGWEVELYVDNKLTDYTTTGKNGFYNFNTDIFYGASNVELKMYGPNGEYRTQEKIIRVPYNLIPKKTIEYSVAAGQGEMNQEKGTYLQANSYYGLLNSLTMGLNFDIPITHESEEKPLAGLDATYQMFTNLTINSSLTPNYALKGRLNFSYPSIININTGYSYYFENEIRNPIGKIYGINFSASSPLKVGHRYLGLRYYISLDKYQTFVATNMNYGFNFSFYPFYLTYIGQYKKTNIAYQSSNNISSQILLSAHFYRSIRPQFRIDYDHTDHQVSKYGAYLAQRIFRSGQLSLSMERNIISKSNTIMLNFNWLSAFADITSRMVRSNRSMSMNQMFKGSVRYDREAHQFQFDRRRSVGYGVAVVRPFLDHNYNGVMDEGEKYIPGLRAKINGARINLRGDKKEYYYTGLRPYDDYTVQIDQYSLDNPMLKPTHENYRVKIEPNIVTAIQVPIVTTSEISGQVKRLVGHVKAGIGGIRVNLIDLSKETIIELTTFNSGDYYYLGLVPGTYRAYIDSDILSKYGYQCTPKSIKFEVKPVEGGVTIENIDFLLSPANADTTATQQ
ncbi:MAG: hypothetical protein GXO93_04550 [FCB group bacterium]|nr:hypothetical protein [FCB group bacterium]